MLTNSLALRDFPRIATYKPRRNLNDERDTSCWPMVKKNYSGFGVGLSKKLSIRRRDSDEPTPLTMNTPRASSNEGDELGEWGFEAREARLDQEFWAAAWLRAECYFENRGDERNAERNKLEFADGSFKLLKQRSNTKLGLKNKCIIMVKNEDGKSTLIERVVGTLDLNVEYFKPVKTFPEQVVVPPPGFVGPMDRRDRSNSYGHISNVCVAKSARRRGYASRMVEFALSTAMEQGMEKVFLHVVANNEAAMGLYAKMGFKVVDEANGEGTSERLMLCYEASR